MKKVFLVFALFCFATLVFTTSCLAQAKGKTRPKATTSVGKTAAKSNQKNSYGYGGNYNRHNIALFGGATTGLYDGASTLPTLGFEYEYRVNNLLGVGLFTQALLGDGYTNFVLGVPVVVHPIAGFKGFAAPLLEFAKGYDFTTLKEKWQSEFGFGIGAGYNFNFDRFVVAPSLSFDRVAKHNSLVYGVSFGLGF